MIGEQSCGFLAKWKAFLMGKFERNEILVVAKDTWDLFYDLQKETQGNIANFVDDGCWPAIIDEFVEMACQQ